MFHTHRNAPPACALCEIASPSVPPITISSSIPAVTMPEAITSTIEIRRTFQNGRVSIRSYALLTDLTTEPIAPEATQTAANRPITSATIEPPPPESCLEAADQIGDRRSARPG